MTERYLTSEGFLHGLDMRGAACDITNSERIYQRENGY